MFKEIAIEQFIGEIEENNYQAVIVKLDNADVYYCLVSADMKNADETIVYSYGAFVNSSANLDVNDIVKRFKATR